MADSSVMACMVTRRIVSVYSPEQMHISRNALSPGGSLSCGFRSGRRGDGAEFLFSYNGMLPASGPISLHSSSDRATYPERHARSADLLSGSSTIETPIPSHELHEHFRNASQTRDETSSGSLRPHCNETTYGRRRHATPCDEFRPRGFGMTTTNTSARLAAAVGKPSSQSARNH